MNQMYVKTSIFIHLSQKQNYGKQGHMQQMNWYLLFSFLEKTGPKQICDEEDDCPGHAGYCSAIGQCIPAKIFVTGDKAFEYFI